MALLKIKEDEYFNYRIWQEENCFVQQRLIYFGNCLDGYVEETGDVNNVSAAQIIKNLLFLDAINHKPIRIICNSPGGSIYQGLGIIDTIEAIESPVHFVGVGEVCSMATIIMQMCERRLLMPNTTFMIHDGSENIIGPYRTAEAWWKHSEKATTLMYNIYLNRIREKHPRYSLDKLKEICSHDKIMTAAEAVDLGLADSVITKIKVHKNAPKSKRGI